MIPFESTLPWATNILIVYITVRMNGQFNVYLVKNDTRWNHHSNSWQFFFIASFSIRIFFCIVIWMTTESQMIQFESTLPWATNILIVYITVHMNGQFNVYPVKNDTRWNRLSISYQYSYSLHRYADERSVQYIPGHKWYLLKPHLYQLPRLLCFTLLWVWKVSWMYTKSYMIPFESTFASAANILILYITVRMNGQNGQFNVYPVINDTCWNLLFISC